MVRVLFSSDSVSVPFQKSTASGGSSGSDSDGALAIFIILPGLLDISLGSMGCAKALYLEGTRQQAKVPSHPETLRFLEHRPQPGGLDLLHCFLHSRRDADGDPAGRIVAVWLDEVQNAAGVGHADYLFHLLPGRGGLVPGRIRQLFVRKVLVMHVAGHLCPLPLPFFYLRLGLTQKAGSFSLELIVHLFRMSAGTDFSRASES